MPRTPDKFKDPDNELVNPTTQPSTSLTPGIVTASMIDALQSSNAEESTLRTLSGIDTRVRPLQPENAFAPILVTPEEHVTVVIDETLEGKTSWIVRSRTTCETNTFWILLQPQNAESSIHFTLSGTVTLVRPLQPENASSPMLFTPFGIVTLVRPLQLKSAEKPMLVTGLPPSIEGTTIAPLVEVGTAVEDDEPPPSDALPLETVYVHVMPSTVSVSAQATLTDITAAKRIIVRIVLVLALISSRLSFTSNYFPMSALVRPHATEPPRRLKIGDVLLNRATSDA